MSIVESIPELAAVTGAMIALIWRWKSDSNRFERLEEDVKSTVKNSQCELIQKHVRSGIADLKATQKEGLTEIKMSQSQQIKKLEKIEITLARMEGERKAFEGSEL